MCEVRNDKQSLKGWPDRIVTEREPYYHSMYHSFCPGYEPEKRIVPGIYQLYFNEDKIIPTMLSFNYKCKFYDSFYIYGDFMKQEDFLISNDFCFVFLFSYLEKNHYFENSKYVHILEQYLEIFTLTKTKDRKSIKDFEEQYKFASRPRFVAHEALSRQQEIAEENQKILTFKK